MLAAAVATAAGAVGLERANLWSSNDGAANGVSGRSPVTAQPRATQVPPAFYDGQDAAARLTAWLNALPDGAVAAFDATQDLLCQTGIKVSGKSNLTVRDVGLVRTATELRRGDPGVPASYIGAHLFFKTCPGLHVEGRYRVHSTNTVAGGAPGFGRYNADYEQAAALRLDFSSGFRMNAKLDVDGVWGDCIQLEICPDFDIALDPTGFCDRNGRQGITPLGLGGKITGFRLLHGNRTAFDLEPNGAARVCGDIEISDYQVRTRLLPFSAAGGGPVDNIYIHDGTSDGGVPPVLRITPPAGVRRRNWKIERHHSLVPLGPPLSAVRATSVDDLAVIDCSLGLTNTPPSRPHISVDLTDCGGAITITGNDFAPGGSFVRNTTPAADQVLTVQPDQQVI